MLFRFKILQEISHSQLYSSISKYHHPSCTPKSLFHVISPPKDEDWNIYSINKALWSIKVVQKMVKGNTKKKCNNGERLEITRTCLCFVCLHVKYHKETFNCKSIMSWTITAILKLLNGIGVRFFVFSVEFLK